MLWPVSCSRVNSNENVTEKRGATRPCSRAGLAAQGLANAIQEARDGGGYDSGFLGTRCMCYGWEVRCTAALVRPCQPLYTCGSRWTFAHLLHCTGGRARYASAPMMAIEGCDG